MKSLNLISSIFKLNFGSGSMPVVPEPATLLLLGFVLISIAFLGRKKFTSKTHRV
jgi:hypothetical protein